MTFQDNNRSTWRVEAYMRSPEFVQGRCPVKRVIYIRLPHPAMHQNHGQYQVRSICNTFTTLCKMLGYKMYYGDTKALNVRCGSLWYRFCFQFASLYNPVDKRVKERVKKMLLLGVTQRSEMR